MSYKNYYEAQLEEAQGFQDFVMRELAAKGIIVQVFGSKQYQYGCGESVGGDEIKFDKRAKETPNLYIETHEKSHPDNPNYVKSGVFRSDNTIRWIQGNYDSGIWVFDKKALLDHVLKSGLRKIQTPTSIGYLLPKTDADKICTAKFRFNEKGLFQQEKLERRHTDLIAPGNIPERKERPLFDFGDEV